MTIPPSKLLEILPPGLEMFLRRSDNTLEGRISYTRALHLAGRGEIEGVVKPSGTLKFLRRLPERAIELATSQDALDHAVPLSSSSSVISSNSLGVYKQEVRSVTGTRLGVDPHGNPAAIEEYEVIGHVYAFSLLRDVC